MLVTADLKTLIAISTESQSESQVPKARLDSLSSRTDGYSPKAPFRLNKIRLRYRQNLLLESQICLNTVSFWQEAGDRGSFACLHVLNACLHVLKHATRGTEFEKLKECRKIWSSVNNLTKLSSEQPNSNKIWCNSQNHVKSVIYIQLHSI